MTQNAKKNKNAKNTIEVFFDKIAKKMKMEIFVFCVITFEPIYF